MILISNDFYALKLILIFKKKIYDWRVFLSKKFPKDKENKVHSWRPSPKIWLFDLNMIFYSFFKKDLRKMRENMVGDVVTYQLHKIKIEKKQCSSKAFYLHKGNKL